MTGATYAGFLNSQTKPFMDKQTEIFGYFNKYYSGYPPSDIQGFLNTSEIKE